MKRVNKLLVRDPYLKPYKTVLSRRIEKIGEMEARLTQGRMVLEDFASGHEYFGLHFHDGQWIFREWAPNATAIFLIGEMTDWQENRSYSLERINDQGGWEIRLDSGAVLMDIVHSHAVSNQVEGLSHFDGTPYLYFHDGPRGHHIAWDSRCFDYGKLQVIHSIRPDAITIAEDISGMPGLALPLSEGEYGFDYRFAMGVPDSWIKLLKDTQDDHWHMGGLWYELTNRREEEKTIRYAESHDQALVGDKTIIFRRIDADIYEHNPTQSYSDYHITVKGDRYQMILDSDAKKFGGHGRLVQDQEHITLSDSSHQMGRPIISVYFPNRTAIVLQATNRH